MKIFILDDDPTGSQTVSNCPLLLSWDEERIIEAIKYPSPFIFILANTRSLPPHLAKSRTEDICNSILKVLKKEAIKFQDIFFVSRGDSTLRGHWLLEPEAIGNILGPFDATLHIPAFLEGNRTTVNSIHLLNDEPVHTTPFASDHLFGYATSKLDDWLEEKSNGKIASKDVASLKIDLLEKAAISEVGMTALIDNLLEFKNNKHVVVDGSSYRHLQALGKAVRILAKDKRFLFRSAASFINSLSDVPPEVYLKTDLTKLRIKKNSQTFKPGLVSIGSYVPLADKQLEVLLDDLNCIGIELPLRNLVYTSEKKPIDKVISQLEDNLVSQLEDILAVNKTPVLYTSRGEITFSSVQLKLDFGLYVAQLMARLVARVRSKLGYVISKGGITTHVLLQEGLRLGHVHLKGQLLPGLSLVLAEGNMDEEPLPILTFPGNLGDSDTLLIAWQLMQ